MASVTHEIGQGWFAQFSRTGSGEEIVLRHPIAGIEIALPPASVNRLRTILSTVTKAEVS